MKTKNWLLSIHSDGTDDFLSNPSPKIGDKIKVRLRMAKNPSVKHVLILSFPDGIEHFEEMSVLKIEHSLVYYEAELEVSENRLQYQFYIVCDDIIYYYTQNGITTYIPDHTYDFVILADYEQPEWVKDSVFYQIFPERFCNGNQENDVKTGEYAQNGFETIKIENWEKTPLDYEHGHCLDFYGGDLEGIIQKIPYLKKLGITALYLNPIFVAPSVHKYDCLDYFHVDPHFGGDEALEKLSTELHENGMKLILDISINHTGTDHKWFNRDCAWFPKSVGAYNNPESEERGYYFFGEKNSYLGWFNVETMPTLNYTSKTLRDKIYRAKDSVLKKWLNPPYNIDGWRFDVADVFARNGKTQLDKELWPEICSSIKAENPKAYILAEDWGDCPEHLQGDQWDSPMNYYACARPIRQFFGEPDLFMTRHPLLRGVSYKMTADDLKNRVMEHFAKLPFAMWENQFNLIDSHDVGRLHNNQKISFEQYCGAVIFQFMLTGAPSVYYGDEAEIEGITATMEGCRYPMPWNSDFEKTRNYKLYSKIIRLRNEKEVLRRGGMKFICSEGRTFALARFYKGEAFVAVISNEETETKIKLPLSVIGAKSFKTEVFGKDFELSETPDGEIELSLKPGESFLFECEMI